MAAELLLTVPIKSSSTNMDNTMTFSSIMMPLNNTQSDEFRNKKTAFLRDFDQWIVSKKNEYVQSRDHQHRAIMADEDNQEKMTRRIEATLAKAAEMESTYEMQKRGLDASEKWLESLKLQQMKKREQLQDLQHKTQTIAAEVQGRKTALEEKRRKRVEESQILQPELIAYEDRLKLHIGVIRADELVFKYTHINEEDLNQVHQFAVDVKEKLYRVYDCHPPVPDLEANVKLLNESRDIFDFMKRMRRSFIEYAASSNSKHAIS